MEREHFLAQPDVEQFVRWLTNHLPTLQVHLKCLPSQFVPRGLDVQVQGIEAVQGLYAGIPEISVSPAPVPPRAHPGR